MGFLFIFYIMKTSAFLIVGIILLCFIGCGFSIDNELHVSKVANVKVNDLQQQQIISGSKSSMHTEIRYLVITNKGTFICEKSYWNGHYNASDIFFNLKKDSVYTLTTSGRGKSFFFDYKNILKAER